MRIAINAISATAGGGLTYLLNLTRILPEQSGHRYFLFIPPSALPHVQALPENFEVVAVAGAQRGYLGRVWWEQVVLPREAGRWAADVLICLGNFCPLWCSVPVVLLSRNLLYFERRFFRDLLERRHYAWAARHLVMRQLALWSARAARLTITPTDAMGEMLRTSGGGGLRVRTLHHGFQPWPNLNGQSRETAPASPPFRLLVVSHYNYFRNFETVIRAVARLRRDIGPDAIRLYLTTHLAPGLKQGGYDCTRAFQLMQRLGIQDAVTTLGPVPYDDLPAVYRSSHAVICPAYAESFSHTVLEAMSMGIPVIASDIGVHREVAAQAALFFSPNDPNELASRCTQLMRDSSLRARLSLAGLERARDFSWQRHFQELLAMAAEVASGERT